MTGRPDPTQGVNSWLEDELYQQYLHDHGTVDASWKRVFEHAGNGGATPSSALVAERTAPVPPKSAAPAVELAAADQLQPLRGAAARVAENMVASLAIPTASSQRVIPVKVIDENRRMINQHRQILGQGKVSYTHILGWAIVQALKSHPVLNQAYLERDGEPYRIVRGHVNLGIAVDVPAKDGTRNLYVPNVKSADELDFHRYVAAFDDIVRRSRSGKLAVADFQGTTISLTNPGTVGTVQSVPRLMHGQGAIIAVGTIDYPAEFAGVSAEMRATLGISKVTTITCTYDHRVIQGAESGMFLGKIQGLLEGQDDFYEEIFAHLRLPYQPVKWSPDRQMSMPGAAGRTGEVAKEAAVLQLINAYRVRGHLIADLDPLGGEPSYHPELDPATYGLSLWDLDREFLTGSLGDAIGEGAPQPVATLRQILETLRRTYCGKIGCEYMNIQHPDQKRWLQQRMEPEAASSPLDREEKVRILEDLIEAEEFEHFLHSRYIGHKRFSLEGAEAVIAALHELLDRAADNNVREVVIGMAHRGRINVLANIVGKPLTQVFSEFEGNNDPTSMQGSGDVKYHLGASGVHLASSGREIVVSVSPNPSHLEAVNPVVEGIVRPKQDHLGDAARERIIPVLLHGDAAFAGQGVVAETLNLSQLPGYRTGGTVHLIINNQIGFTASPEESRSTPYSTDVARTVQAPIFHVNGDDPEAVIRVAQIAFDYRQRFKKDVVIDLFCYRRHGHNETDDPSYTQPIMYRKIRQHPSVTSLYVERMLREGLLTPSGIEAIRRRILDRLTSAWQAAQEGAERFELQELSAVPEQEIATFCPRTAIDMDTLRRLIQGATSFPEDFHLHPKLRGFVEKRRDIAGKGGVADWALGETLAFGSLVLEGTPVRLSGQDSGRGTFSQRHLMFVDSETGREHVPLKHLSPDQARFDVYDSSLSEYAVLGFEFGYSLADPLTLVLWEAQFGDFVNGAQIMIDQFLSSAESKWGQPSGLVLLLPHGYEGQGPEHSSARIERFLTLCAENNMQVANCSTPAQYFHLLRRQMFGGSDRRGVRKPLIIFTPKSLLRHPKAVSLLQEFTSGSFREVVDEPAGIKPESIARVVFCTGKVYYDLLAAREERKAHQVALVRVEQLYPFPAGQVRDVLERFKAAPEVFWVQEEPRNMGPWRFVREQLESLLEDSGRMVRYIGRRDSASPAAGNLKRHQQEQTELLDEAMRFQATPERKPRTPVRRKK